MKYHIKTGVGSELTVRNGQELVMLLRQSFLDPEDEVRTEGSQRWRKVKEIPEYAAVLRAERSDTSQFKRIFFVTFLVGLLVIIGAILF